MEKASITIRNRYVGFEQLHISCTTYLREHASTIFKAKQSEKI